MLDIDSLPPASLDRMVRAVEKVRERLLRTAAILEAAKIPYAVIGGNAVAAWVSRVDEAAVRNTQDVDILLRREDFPAARAAMEAAGFVFREMRFIDGPDVHERHSVRIQTGNDVIVSKSIPSPDQCFLHLDLEPLVEMELSTHRVANRMNLRDLIDVELIDTAWPARFPGELGRRLQAILDNPEG
jgi:hypothetical protein